MADSMVYGTLLVLPSRLIRIWVFNSRSLVSPTFISLHGVGVAGSRRLYFSAFRRLIAAASLFPEGCQVDISNRTEV
jgi:hypothetical protein